MCPLLAWSGLTSRNQEINLNQDAKVGCDLTIINYLYLHFLGLNHFYKLFLALATSDKDIKENKSPNL